MAIAAIEDLELDHIDISNAFLNSKMEYDVYLRQPDGFVIKGKEHLVCKLVKSLYGIKQGPHDWYHTLNTSREDPWNRGQMRPQDTPSLSLPVQVYCRNH